MNSSHDLLRDSRESHQRYKLKVPPGFAIVTSGTSDQALEAPLTLHLAPVLLIQADTWLEDGWIWMRRHVEDHHLVIHGRRPRADLDGEPLNRRFVFGILPNV